MINVMSVLSCFQMLTGVQNGEQERFLPLCSAAAAELSARVRAGDTEAFASRLVFAAAALAAYRYRLIAAAQEEHLSFKAGDVSVTKKSADSASMAQKVYEQALADIAPVLGDGGFVFQNM